MCRKASGSLLWGNVLELPAAGWPWDVSQQQGWLAWRATLAPGLCESTSRQLSRGCRQGQEPWNDGSVLASSMSPRMQGSDRFFMYSGVTCS